MATTALDTLKIADKFTKAGFEEKKAHALAETFGDLANEEMVTKDDLDARLEKLEMSLTIKLAVIVTAVLGFFKLMEGFFGGG